MAYGVFRRRPRIVPKTSNQVYYMTPTVNPEAVDTYMTYNSAGTRLETYVDGTKTHQSKRDGSTQIIGVLQSDSGRIKKTVRITGNYNILPSDSVIFCDTDGGAFVVNLPAIIDGTHYKIKNTGTSGNDVTLTPDGTDKLFGVNASEPVHDGEVFDIEPEMTEGWW